MSTPLFEFTLPGYDRPPLSMNDRSHWAKRAAVGKQVKQIAHMLTRNELTRRRHRHPDYRVDPPVVIDLVWYVTDRRRRDNDNPSITRKFAVDGVCEALGFDDTYWNVSGGTVIERGTDRAIAVRVRAGGAQ